VFGSAGCDRLGLGNVMTAQTFLGVTTDSSSVWLKPRRTRRTQPTNCGWDFTLTRLTDT
jgi:hypothetical protein